VDAAGPLIVSGYIRDDDDGEEEEAPFLGFGVRFYIVGGRDRDIYLLSFLDYRCPSCVRFQKVSYRKFRQFWLLFFTWLSPQMCIDFAFGFAQKFLLRVCPMSVEVLLPSLLL
jgi:hypothetical protein